ncbi:uncharacterized protein [Taeniopygia guttata]|uniref:uncharacterized protein n=1 Tax=Taeniopygia guttata TaxID=59729 RepID=UPI003BB8E918
MGTREGTPAPTAPAHTGSARPSLGNVPPHSLCQAWRCLGFRSGSARAVPEPLLEPSAIRRSADVIGTRRRVPRCAAPRRVPPGPAPLGSPPAVTAQSADGWLAATAAPDAVCARARAFEMQEISAPTSGFCSTVSRMRAAIAAATGESSSPSSRRPGQRRRCELGAIPRHLPDGAFALSRIPVMERITGRSRRLTAPSALPPPPASAGSHCPPPLACTAGCFELPTRAAARVLSSLSLFPPLCTHVCPSPQEPPAPLPPHCGFGLGQWPVLSPTEGCVCAWLVSLSGDFLQLRSLEIEI